MEPQILNSLGQPIVLNARELARATALQAQFDNELRNALGADISITTLTAISKRVVEQKFFQIAPAEYMPVRVGEGAWSDQIMTYRDFNLAADFETGNINTAASDSRLAEADAGVDAVFNPIINWAKQLSWTIMDLNMAAKSGNWDLVTSKERARKKNWDLGIQRIAFLGSRSDSRVMGLLTQTGVNSNTAIITEYISGMSPSEFATFVQTIVEAYRSNAVRTAYPTHFVMPEGDYNGLATPVSADFPNVTKLQYLLDAFKLITRNPNFQIMPCAYADQANNADVSGLNKNRYSLYNYDEDTLRMDIPVDYTNTLQNTINGFQFQNVGYGQYTGVLAYRPLEMLYFDWAA
jgi:hypothetical protein